MQSKAATVSAYLKALPADRRAALEAVRKVIRDNLDGDYEEGMQYGMIGYYVPHRVFPHGYHCDPKQPLPFAGLASQKNHLSVYLMGLYSDGQDPESVWFRKAWAQTGKKLDMGKCCVRWKKVDDLALDVLGQAVARMPVAKFVSNYVAALAAQGKGPDGRKLAGGATPRKTAKKAAAKAPRTKASPRAGTRRPARG